VSELINGRSSEHVGRLLGRQIRFYIIDLRHARTVGLVIVIYLVHATWSHYSRAIQIYNCNIL